MLRPRSPAVTAAVAGHYDELDALYRAVWGEHVHHGLWWTGHESSARATRNLVDLVVQRAAVRPGARVVDVGCGYGATARVLAREHGASVRALTVSGAQHAHARGLPRRAGDPDYELSDWLANVEGDGRADAVIAIESIAHMGDKARALRECARVLRPGGRLVVCDWLTAERPGRLARQALLQPICREGRLPSMGSAREYADLMRSAGLVVDGFEDLSRRVRRTWRLCLARAARELARSPEARQLALDRASTERLFALSLVRIPVAYTTGAMVYGVLSAHVPRPG